MTETLPVGQGRVPQWWMDITPHYQLDEEDDYARQAAQDQMDWYYMQLASAEEAGFLDANGNPRSDVDWSSWSPSWNGRSGGGGGGSNLTGGPGGRSFKPGQPVIDPKLFGISEMDPDYKSYLTGAKLPPGYFEKMGELSRHETGGVEGILNNMKQTDYGRYGRQAEKPNFKPAWAKKKLRSTNIGANIRQGQYDDSPNKHIRRRVQTAPVAPSIEPEPESEPANPTMTRTVRKIQPQGTGAPAEQKKYDHSAYYNNEPPPVMSEQERALKEKQEKLKRLQELQRQQQEMLRKQQEEQQQAQYHNDDEYEEEIIEEEIIEEEFTEGSYEEEVIEDDDDEELTDLHAILAAKQAELQRLQAQM